MVFCQGNLAPSKRMWYNDQNTTQKQVIPLENKQNLHTHTTFADGKDTPEELILAAMDKGFTGIGFSEHCYNPYSTSTSQMQPQAVPQYQAEIRALKGKYKGKIDVFCGLELEYYCDDALENYDYVIGSVHYLDFDGQVLGFDRDLEETLDYVNTHFAGDGLAFAKKYYETVIHLPEKGKIDILGHFDLLTKNNEQGKFVDTTDKKYLDFGFEAIHALKGKIPIFEVNTGAMARGYRTAPYPQLDFMKEFRKCGFGVAITSDCHDKNNLDCHFAESRQLLQEAGFTTHWILTDDGFREVRL